jgi:Uma2 family endonuclease
VAVQPNITWPTHLDLPDTDGLPVENDFQDSQAWLLSSAIEPLLEQWHPQGDYFVGADVGIYWKATRPPLNGCKVPDWYYVRGCRKMPEGEYRRSYVMWDEGVNPLIVMEFVSGGGTEEHDDTPGTGKFWVYRRGIHADYYAIHSPDSETLELYRLDGGDYRRVKPNRYGHLVIDPLGLALGHWRGKFGRHTLTWARFFNLDGTMLPSGREQVEAEKARADEEKARADKAAADMAELLAKLQAKGIDPNTL